MRPEVFLSDIRKSKKDVCSLWFFCVWFWSVSFKFKSILVEYILFSQVFNKYQIDFYLTFFNYQNTKNQFQFDFEILAVVT
jgi:hypothetical protein